MQEDVQQWLKAWLASKGKITALATESFLATDYFEAGWLTSMEVVEFVTEIEGRFAMQFSESDLQDRRFATIAGLAELIFERSTQTSESR